MREMEFEFCVAEQVMHQMEEVVNQMKREVLSGFEEAVQEIGASWKQEAGCRFQELAGREVVQMRQTVRCLENVNACIQDAILTAKQTEEKTEEIARLRTY